MEFKKITISIPKNMYNESISLVKKGLFSNFSDIVRAGIREELRGLKHIQEDFDEKVVYDDKELIKGVKLSKKEASEGKGKIVKEKDLDKYFDYV
jgi:Arc/MetJ-type ribon-helix-helix transcriptional regulator